MRTGYQCAQALLEAAFSLEDQAGQLNARLAMFRLGRQVTDMARLARPFPLPEQAI